MNIFTYPFVLASVLLSPQMVDVTPPELEQEMLQVLREGTAEEKGNAALKLAAGFAPSEKYTEALEALLGDATQLPAVQVDSEVYDLQLRDAALFALIALSGKSSGDFGVETVEIAEELREIHFSFLSLTEPVYQEARLTRSQFFKNAAAREAGIAKWKKLAK